MEQGIHGDDGWVQEEAREKGDLLALKLLAGKMIQGKS
jgi:hypothetical protein